MSEAEETLIAEAVRRQLVLEKRREIRHRERQAAERRETLETTGRVVDVEVTGTFEASARCHFLFDRARVTGGVSLSSDLGTAACTGSGSRGMVLGSRGYRAGLHYWEVRESGGRRGLGCVIWRDMVNVCGKSWKVLGEVFFFFFAVFFFAVFFSAGLSVAKHSSTGSFASIASRLLFFARDFGRALMTMMVTGGSSVVLRRR